MEANDTPVPREDDHAPRPVSPTGPPNDAIGSSAGSAPRKDDRNEETEGSPVPDPEEEQGDAEDVPQAD
jgi:hypothetical protein